MTVKTFIDRPILSGVISVAIIIVGLIGLSQLPIEQFPDIAPPTVRVTATYTGSASISVYFRQGTDPDMSVVNVQNRVADRHAGRGIDQHLPVRAEIPRSLRGGARL